MTPTAETADRVSGAPSVQDESADRDDQPAPSSPLPLYLSMIELRADDTGRLTQWGYDPARDEVWAPASMLPHQMACAVALSSGELIWDSHLVPFVRAAFLVDQIEAVEESEWVRCGFTREQARQKIARLIATARACALNGGC